MIFVNQNINQCFIFCHISGRSFPNIYFFIPNVSDNKTILKNENCNETFQDNDCFLYRKVGMSYHAIYVLSYRFLNKEGRREG